MRHLEIKNATASLAHYARAIRKEPMILTAHGKPIAALILISNADRETVTLSMHPKFLKVIERSRKQHKRYGGISSEDMRRRVGVRPRGQQNGS